MKKTHKTKSITCRIVSTGTVMQVNTIDEILSPGQYKIDACGVTASDGFPDGVEGECLSAYLEVSDTNHSADNLKSAAVGQTLTYTDADGDTAVYHRSGTNKDGKVEWSAWSDTAALGLQNGSITSEKLSKDVRTKIDSPLRSLFIAAGAEYNDTGADITKTAPWGESVIHKAGHYYLNGLGDITEEQMIAIYNHSNHYALSNNMQTYFAYTEIRTNICRNSVGWGLGEISNSVLMFYNSKIEIAVISNFKWTTDDKYCFQAGDVATMFDYCNYLKRIIGVLNVTSYTKGLNSLFNRCPVLISVKLKGLNANISIKDSPNIDKESILYMIQKANPISNITITLHPNVFSNLKDNIDLNTALEAQPLISLVSA